jgi:hypothetical protein
VLNTGGTDTGDCNWPPAEGHDWSIVHNAPMPSEVMGPNGSMKVCWTCTGLPVNTASGDFWHSFTDFDIPGRGRHAPAAHFASEFNRVRQSSSTLPSPLPSTTVRRAWRASNRIRKLEASAGFEPAVEVLQTSALPLG